ncbi:hypothetical protein Dimus_026862 [Dionaea muscipula]
MEIAHQGDFCPNQWWSSNLLSIGDLVHVDGGLLLAVVISGLLLVDRQKEEEGEEKEEEEEEEEAQNADFDWEVVVDEAADQEESGLGEKFYDAEDEIQESAAVVDEVPAVAAQVSAQQKETEAAGVDPSGPSGHILDLL